MSGSVNGQEIGDHGQRGIRLIIGHHVTCESDGGKGEILLGASHRVLRDVSRRGCTVGGCEPRSPSLLFLQQLLCLKSNLSIVFCLFFCLGILLISFCIIILKLGIK